MQISHRLNLNLNRRHLPIGRPSSGGSYQGARGLDQLSSPMRSRVEIVARKSDHICVVRDVPDTRGSWYQRQQQSSQSNYSLGGSQHSSIGSLDHPAPPPQAQQASSSSGPAVGAGALVAPSASGHLPAAGGQPSSSAKPSFAALFGKHPAIKEEPTTPGGTLTSETPPPSGSLLGAGRRSPFKSHLQPSGAASGSAAATGGSPGASQATAPYQVASVEQISQIIGLLNELKLDLRQNIGQLTKRVDSMDASVSRVTQTVGRLDKHYVASLSASSVPPPGEFTGAAGLEPSKQVAPAASSASQRPTTKQTEPRSTDDSAGKPKQAAATGSSTEQAGGSVADPSQRRERSKSPHKHHHHHHHHHHHRKATHPTPGSTPTTSQADLRQPKAGEQQQAGSSTGATELTAPAVGSSGARETEGKTESAGAKQATGRQYRAPGSFEQSDDDQDATSKL